MAEDNARQQLLDFLDEKAFNPVLNADPQDYPESQRKKLDDVRKTTRSTQKRYHDNYTTAKDVVENYQSDLSSESAKAVQRELRDLNLPTLDSIKPEFEDLARKLGVK